MSDLSIAQAAAAANASTHTIQRLILIGRFGDPTATTVDSDALTAFLTARAANHSTTLDGV